MMIFVKKQMNQKKSITLKHLLINFKKQIGLQFYTDKVIIALTKELPEIKWSDQYGMYYLPNTKQNLNKVFENFRGIAWINCNHFFHNRPVNTGNQPIDISSFRNRKCHPNYRFCPEEYLSKLELKKYALNTVKVYVSGFEAFINYYKDVVLSSLDENDVRNYLKHLIKQGKSDSYLNMAVNSIKFYYEVVMEMPNRFYSIERPRKTRRLPEVLCLEEIKKMIEVAENSKHRCILSLLYSAGLRRSELLTLKINDIDSNRMLIRINDAKGNKDRYSLLSTSTLADLRLYWKEYKPRVYLFEGQKGG